MNTPVISPTPNIHKARFEAKRLLLSVERDGVNADAGYSYVKTDSMIEACRPVLDQVGLDVSRTDYAIAEDRSKTISVFEVCHPASGELRTHKVEFPVFYDGEQDDDKAVAASLTTAWSYWLRDFLMLPRKDGNEMDSRSRVPSSAPSTPTSPRTRDMFNGPRQPPREQRNRHSSQIEAFTGHPAQWETIRMIVEGHGKRLTDKWKARLEQRFRGRMMAEIPGIVSAEIADMQQNSNGGRKKSWWDQRGRNQWRPDA